jgi:hypothetical protein
MKTSNLVLLDEQTINPIYLNSDPTLSSNTPPPLGDLSITTGGIKPIKSNLLLQSDVLPVDSPYAQDMPSEMSCEQKWENFAMTARFGSEKAMLEAKSEFLAKCKGVGTSVISDPTKDLFPNLLIPSNGGVGGGGGMGANEEGLQPITKKPFPYWILIAGAVGAYLIFRKK